MDEELLISLVENYKELYDLQHPNYDDNQRRNNIWEEIAAITKQSAKECRERWRRIRDNYRRAIKLRKTKSGQGAKNMKTPKYDKILSFLMPYMDNENETVSNMPPQNSPTDTNDVTDDEDETSQASSSGNAPVSSVTTGTPQAKRKYFTNHKSPLRSSQSSSTQNLFEKYIERKYNTQKQPDTITTFFENLGETVKKFPEDVQIRVKREVFKIVSEAEEEVFLNKKSMMGSNAQIINPSHSHSTHNHSQYIRGTLEHNLPQFCTSNIDQSIQLTQLQPATSIIQVQDSLGEFLNLNSTNQLQ